MDNFIGAMAPAERAVYQLRSLYEGMGYRKFRMSRFEEYDLYLENRSFLQTDGIVTFTGPSGRLMALKPDVTLSIMKSMRGEKGFPQKLYYTENVYRAARGSRDVREIMQVGLEYVGELSLYALAEVVSLAMDSLNVLDAGYILDISHMGLVTALLDAAGLSGGTKETAVECISGKNIHELHRLLAAADAPAEAAAALERTAGLSGAFDEALRAADEAAGPFDAARAAVGELRALYETLRSFTDTSRLRLDFSIVNDMSYYNGFIFRGYVPGVPCGVLSGGRYDSLVRHLSGAPGAVGFAVNFDQLGYRQPPSPEYDADVLIVCPDDGYAAEAAILARRLRNAGKSVCVQSSRGGVRTAETISLGEAEK